MFVEFRLSSAEVENMKLLLNYISVKAAPHAVRDEAQLRPRWKKFILEWKEIKYPKLYYVRADLRDAYPSVDTNLLRKIIEETVVDEDDLIVKQYLPIGASMNKVS